MHAFAPTFAGSISHDLFQQGIPILEKVLRTVGVYLGLLVLLRLGGKRDLAQLNSFDLVVLLLLSNVVQNAVIGADNTLTGGLLGAAVLVAVNAVVVRVAGRADRLAPVFEGTPTPLITDGVMDVGAIKRVGLRVPEVQSAIRRQSASTPAEVQNATLEPGGTISVQLWPEAEDATKGDLARVEAKLDQVLRALKGEPPIGPVGAPQE